MVWNGIDIILQNVPQLVGAFKFNLTNLTDYGIARAMFWCYRSIFGNYFFAIMFGFIGAGIYVNERSIGSIVTYLILVGIFMSIVLTTEVVAIFGVFLAFLLGVIFFKAFIDRT
jgi:hypothetical protein